MAEQFDVALQALAAYAKSAGSISTAFDEIRRELVGSGVQSDSFGLLGESHDVDNAYRERCQDGLDVLASARDLFSSVEDAMGQVCGTYQEADGSARDSFGGAVR